jgi:hypothetical protein
MTMTLTETVIRNAPADRVAELTRDAHRKALERLTSLDPIDQMEEVAAVLSELSAEVAVIVVLLAVGKTDDEVRTWVS